MSKIEQIINVNQATVESTADVIFVNGEAYTFKNTGLTRRVFVNKEKTLVIKVPTQTHFQIHNDNEAKLWAEASDEIRLQLAETKQLSNGYILQEYLHTLDDKDTEAWLGRSMKMSEIRFATSCRNDVGYDDEGRLKCYDYDEFKKY